jgi:hypothetical protein
MVLSTLGLLPSTKANASSPRCSKSSHASWQHAEFVSRSSARLWESGEGKEQRGRYREGRDHYASLIWKLASHRSIRVEKLQTSSAVGIHFKDSAGASLFILQLKPNRAIWLSAQRHSVSAHWMSGEESLDFSLLLLRGQTGDPFNQVDIFVDMP